MREDTRKSSSQFVSWLIVEAPGGEAGRTRKALGSGPCFFRCIARLSEFEALVDL